MIINNKLVVFINKLILKLVSNNNRRYYLYDKRGRFIKVIK